MTMWYTIPLGMFCNLACVSPSRDSRLHAALCWTDNEWAISPLQRNIIPNNSRRKVVMLTWLSRHQNFCRTVLKGIQNVYKNVYNLFSFYIFGMIRTEVEENSQYSHLVCYWWTTFVDVLVLSGYVVICPVRAAKKATKNMTKTNLRNEADPAWNDSTQPRAMDRT